MSNFDWNAHPVVDEDRNEAPTSSPQFDWNAHPVADSRDVAGSPSEDDKIGMARSALVGAGQGATGGFAEEITAPVVAAAGMTKSAFDQSIPTLPGESTWDKYSRLMQTYRDVARDEQNSAQEQNPGSYTAGALAGGAATIPFIPSMGATSMVGKVAAGAAEGAGLGAVYGAGESEGNIQERIPGAIEGAEMGALAGSAIPTAVQGVKTLGKAAGLVGEIPVVARTIENVKRGVKGEKLFSSEGRREAADLVREKGGQLYDDIKVLQKDVGSQIGAKIEDASKAGQKVDLTNEVGDVLEKLKAIKESGSKEAASYAAGIESEINKLLGIKPAQAADDVSRMTMPEGLNPEVLNPNSELAGEVTQYLVDPKVAQDIKQVIGKYTPKNNMDPQRLDAAVAAKEFKGAASQKLDEVSGVNEPTVIENTGGLAGSVVEGPSLGKQYGGLKDSLKRLGVNERRLPSQIKDKIVSTISNLEKESISGDQARNAVDEILANIKQVSPEVAAKYEGPLTDAVERLDLAGKNIGGGGSRGIIGGLGATLGTAGNIAGLGINKLGKIPGVQPVVSNVVGGAQKASTFAQKMIESSNITRPAVSGLEESSVPAIKAAAEPYKLQRQVASASENAEPEVLKEQAQGIRSKYGKQGEQLATILDNMADKDKNARRALMYSVLQNPAHRKMMGLMKKQEE